MSSFLKPEFAVFSLLLLAGCATAPPLQRYVAPAADDAAKLQIRSKITNGGVHVLTFEDSVVCTGRKVIATSGRQDTPELKADTKLAAGRYATLWMLHVKGEQGCQVLFTFLPKANHVYQVRPELLGNYCYMPLIDVTDPVSPSIPPVVKRTVSKNATGNAPACMPLETAAKSETSSSGPTMRPGTLKLDDLKDLLPSTR